MLQTWPSSTASFSVLIFLIFPQCSNIIPILHSDLSSLCARQSKFPVRGDWGWMLCCGCIYSQRWLRPGGMWWHHGRVYIWRRYGPLMMMMREHLRLPVRMREDKKRRLKKKISEGIRGFNSESSTGLWTVSIICTNCYHTDPGLSGTTLSISSTAFISHSGATSGYTDSSEAINEKTISSNKVRRLFPKSSEKLDIECNF